MSYSAAVLADNPVGYWRLGESSGTTATDETGTNAGTYTGTGVTYGVTGLLTGDSNTAVTLDGAAGAVTMGDPVSLQPTNLSVEAWVQWTSTNAPMRIFRKRTFGYMMWLSAGQVSFGFFDSGATFHQVDSAATAYNDGLRHYFVGTYDGTALVLYVDGSQVATNSPAVAISYGGGGSAIGQDGDVGSSFLAATVDEVAVYPTALSSTRIAAHYTAGSVLDAASSLRIVTSNLRN